MRKPGKNVRMEHENLCFQIPLRKKSCYIEQSYTGLLRSNLNNSNKIYLLESIMGLQICLIKQLSMRLALPFMVPEGYVRNEWDLQSLVYLRETR